jgi:uncharacterized protein YjbI with pentapeptide repeats
VTWKWGGGRQQELLTSREADCWYTNEMKIAPPQLPAHLELYSVADVLSDGELEDGRLYDEEAVSMTCPALDLQTVMIEKFTVAGAHLGRINARDIIIIKSDFSAANLSDGSINRASVTNCRMTGLDVSKTILRDVTFQGCKLDLANFRFADLRRVRFIDCTFNEADFMGARLHDVAFEKCTLERTVFDQVAAQKLDLRSSELIDISGWRSLKGVTIDNLQLVTIAPYLAHELGFTVRDV